MGKRPDPSFEFMESFGKIGSRNYNRAKIRVNGRIFDVVFSGKFYGYRGWYEAYSDGEKVQVKPCSKLYPLVRSLIRLFPEA